MVWSVQKHKNSLSNNVTHIHNILLSLSLYHFKSFYRSLRFPRKNVIYCELPLHFPTYVGGKLRDSKTVPRGFAGSSSNGNFSNNCDVSFYVYRIRTPRLPPVLRFYGSCRTFLKERISGLNYFFLIQK